MTSTDGPRIGILDYGVGNLASVRNAMLASGGEPVVSRDWQVLHGCAGLVVPGVGAFPHVMRCLNQVDGPQNIKAWVDSGKAFLGICVGLQILFESSAEFESTPGLNLISGTVERLAVDPDKFRLPHIAWSLVREASQSPSPMLQGIPPEKRCFYFIHSFAATNVQPNVRDGLAAYGGAEIIASVRKNNLWATQFHPEKSGPSGLQLLRNFVRLSVETGG